jgi:hypothetical protein
MKYYVETYETKIRRSGYRETYGSWEFFDSLDQCSTILKKLTTLKQSGNKFFMKFF